MVRPSDETWCGDAEALKPNGDRSRTSAARPRVKVGTDGMGVGSGDGPMTRHQTWLQGKSQN